MGRGWSTAKCLVLGSWPIYRSEMFNRMLDKARKHGYETTIWQTVQRLCIDVAWNLTQPHFLL
jgi:hypothetical protein